MRTIGCFPKYKQIEKVKETEMWILPIAKLLKASKFYYEIKSECFKIINTELYSHISNVYDRFYTSNEGAFKSFTDLISNNTDILMRKKNETKFKLKSTILEKLSIHEIWSSLTQDSNASEMMPFVFNKFNEIQTNKLYLIYEGNIKKEDLNHFLFSLSDLPALSKKFSIIGIGSDTLTENKYYICTDRFKNKYQIYLMNEYEYIKMRNGSTEGVDIPQVYDGEVTSALVRQIKIKTADNDVIVLPENSSVLDFAFKIHNDFGFSVMYAYINNSPNKMPIYTALSDGDKVELIISRNPQTGKCNNISELRWLTYAKTEYAQKKLIKYYITTISNSKHLLF